MTLGVLIACAVPALSSERASAQATDDDLGSTAFATIALFPETRNRAAPAFLQPGVRVTYAVGSATGGGGPAGGGIVQYDVVESDGVQVVAYLHSYANDGAGYYPLSTGRVRGYPGIGDFWIQPSVLANAERFASATLSVTRVTKTLASGQTVNAVRFQGMTQNGQVATEYDSASGVLVFDSVTAGASASQVVLQSVRTLAIPWASGRAPNWVRPGTQLVLSGTKNTTIPGAGTVSQRLDLSFAMQQAGARWSWSTAQSAIDGQLAGTSGVVSGEAQLLGGLWLPVSALAVQRSTAGTRIDVDPSTGAEIYFGEGADGRILLQQVTAVSRTSYFYNPTLGSLDRIVQERALVSSSEATDIVRTTTDASLNAQAAMTPLPEDPPASAAGGGGGGCSTTEPTAPIASAWLLAVLLAARGTKRRLRR